jgi:hypothetical protein
MELSWRAAISISLVPLGGQEVSGDVDAGAIVEYVDEVAFAGVWLFTKNGNDLRVYPANAVRQVRLSDGGAVVG